MVQLKKTAIDLRLVRTLKVGPYLPHYSFSKIKKKQQAVRVRKKKNINSDMVWFITTVIVSLYNYNSIVPEQARMLFRQNLSKYRIYIKAKPLLES